MTTNIFMLGMPSSGKSTLGRQLAKELNYDFLDLDKKIEISEGKKISEIFNLEGEEYLCVLYGEEGWEEEGPPGPPPPLLIILLLLLQHPSPSHPSALGWCG